MQGYLVTADAIRQLRRVAGLSQSGLADALGYSIHTVARWEGSDIPRSASIENHLTLYAWQEHELEPIRNGDVTTGYQRVTSSPEIKI